MQSDLTKATTIDPMLAHVLADIPDDIRATFSPLQIAALARSTQGQAVGHLIDYRVSIPMPAGQRYYVTLLVGRERRNLARLASQGQTQVSRIALFYSVLTATLAGLCLFGMFCALYLLKSLSGINVFEGESPLHPLYVLLRNH